MITFPCADLVRIGRPCTTPCPPCAGLDRAAPTAPAATNIQAGVPAPRPDDPWKAGYLAARRHYGDHPRTALNRIRERLLDMAAARVPPHFRDQLLELAEVAKTALGEEQDPS